MAEALVGGVTPGGQRLNRRDMLGEFGLEVGEAGVAEERREPGALDVFLGYDMGLLVPDHLQAVLDPAQIAVMASQSFRDVGRHPARGGECPQAFRGSPAAKSTVATAPDQLLGLQMELNGADATATELEVESGGIEVAATATCLALHRLDVPNRVEVEIAAPDERGDPLQKALAGVQIAGDGPSPDEHRPFPVLGEARVIELGRLDRNREGSRTRIRPEPEVHAEEVAVGGALLEEVDEALRQPCEMARRAGPRAPLPGRRGSTGRRRLQGRYRSSSSVPRRRSLPSAMTANPDRSASGPSRWNAAACSRSPANALHASSTRATDHVPLMSAKATARATRRRTIRSCRAMSGPAVAAAAGSGRSRRCEREGRVGPVGDESPDDRRLGDGAVAQERAVAEYLIQEVGPLGAQLRRRRVGSAGPLFPVSILLLRIPAPGAGRSRRPGLL